MRIDPHLFPNITFRLHENCIILCSESCPTVASDPVGGQPRLKLLHPVVGPILHMSSLVRCCISDHNQRSTKDHLDSLEEADLGALGYTTPALPHQKAQ